MYSEVDYALATSSPAGLAHVTSGGRWVPYDHLILLNDYLMRVAAGDCPRLIVTMPPRHGKSELISKYFPAWYLGTHPDEQFLLISYEGNFAARWGGRARDLLTAHGGMFGVRVSNSSSAKNEWSIEGRDGVMGAAGIMGAITGKGARIMVIDDPVKDSQDARSATIREKHWDQWVSTLRTRLMPGSATAPPGAVILLMTRWHEDDLAGRLLAAAGVDGDEWETLDLPAFAESDDDPLGRRKGEALCPELFDEEALSKTRKAQGSYWFSAMYQQSPSPAGGLMHKRKNFRYFTVADSVDGQPHVTLHHLDGETNTYDVGRCARAQFVDVAASSRQTADYTVVTTILRTPDGHMLIWDVARRQFELLEVPQFISGEWREHGKPLLNIEEFGHGLGVVQTLRRDGVPIRELRPVGDKVTRALPSIAQYEAHRVFHRRGAEWLGDLEAELLAFPSGKNDDMVDTISYAGAHLDSLGSVVKPRVVRVKHKALSTRW